MRSKIIDLRLAADLLKRIDEAAKINYVSRSGYIRDAIVRRLNSESKQQSTVDRWEEIFEQSVRQSGSADGSV